MLKNFVKHKEISSKGGRIELTVAQALIYYLSRQKAEQFDGTIAPLFGGIFGIYGHGNVAGLGEALWEHRKTLPYFRGQNEQGMALAAVAFAKAYRGRRAMAVTTSIGPGATNMVTASAVAHINRLPLLMLPGDIYASRRPDPVLQQLEDERCPADSVNDCFRPVSRYFDRFLRPEQLLHSLPRAIDTLLDPIARGPVTLAMPQDVQAEVWEFPLEFFEEKIHYIRRALPDRRAVERCAALISGARRPLLVVGGGVHYSGAEMALTDFVEKHRIPVGETQAGKGCLPWDHPMNLGGIGVTGTSAANALARDADLVLCVGTRLSDFPTASKSLFHRKDAALIGLNVNSFDASKAKGELLIGDALEGLKALSLALEGYCTSLAYGKTITEVKAEWEQQRMAITRTPEKGMLPSDAQVVAVVNRSIGPRGIVVSAAGGLPGELHKFWRSSDCLGYHLEYGYSCMGYEIAGGLGVKMAYPGREVYVLVGDGSYLMMHSELLTSIQLGYKINVILLDNRGFGCINRLQKSCGSPPYGNLFPQKGPPPVDFVANARSYGCHAVKVHSFEELEREIRDNRARPESCLIVIDTDPEQGSPGTAWWDVAIAGRSEEAGVRQAREMYQNILNQLHHR